MAHRKWHIYGFTTKCLINFPFHAVPSAHVIIYTIQVWALLILFVITCVCVCVCVGGGGGGRERERKAPMIKRPKDKRPNRQKSQSRK